jgi:hypothetical protein
MILDGFYAFDQIYVVLSIIIAEKGVKLSLQCRIIEIMRKLIVHPVACGFPR